MALSQVQEQRHALLRNKTRDTDEQVAKAKQENAEQMARLQQNADMAASELEVILLA